MKENFQPTGGKVDRKNNTILPYYYKPHRQTSRTSLFLDFQVLFLDKPHPLDKLQLQTWLLTYV